MSWFNTLGAYPERILYSRARYLRNISKLAFGNTVDRTKLTGVFSKIEKVLCSGGFRGERLPMGAHPSVLALAEKQFIDADLVFSEGARSVYFNEPCNLTVAIGGRDLISIQSILPGRAIAEAKNSAAVAEEMLDSELGFAYSESIGYLCERPELCGSGMQLSACLFMPSLRLLGTLDRTRQKLFCRGVMLSPLLSVEGGAGDLYTVCYTPPHLADEQGAVTFFDSLLGELDTLEKSNERMLFPDSSSPLE